MKHGKKTRWRRGARPVRRDAICLRGGESLESRRMMSFDPSPFEQEMLEHVNRFRGDPQAELSVLFSSTSPTLVSTDPFINAAVEHFGVSRDELLLQWSVLSPVPPLRWNASLQVAAEGHNDFMLQADEQQHVFEGEEVLGDRLQTAGYSFASAAENIFAFAESPLHGHAGFVVDWGEGEGEQSGDATFGNGLQDPAGHRNNILSEDFIDVGIAILEDSSTANDVGPLIVTQDFGKPTGVASTSILGVTYNDSNLNGRYDAGEGLGNVLVEVIGQGQTYQTTSFSAGGYQVEVPAGTYQIVFSGGQLNTRRVLTDVVVEAVNVKADLDKRTSWRAPLAQGDMAVGQRDLPLLIDVLENDSDLDGSLNPASVQVVRLAKHGQTSVNVTNGQITYQPDPGFVGNDIFNYLVRDNEGFFSNEVSVSVVINEGNSAPTASSFTLHASGGVSLTIDFTGRVGDSDGTIDFTTLDILAGPTLGQLSPGATASRLEYLAPASASGNDSFTYRVRDDEGELSNVGTVTIQRTPSAQPPVAVNDTFVTSAETQITLDVTTNDSDLDGDLVATSIRVSALAQRGSVVRSASNDQFVYTPSLAFQGLDVFRYEVLDSQQNVSNEATVRVYVVDPNHPFRNPDLLQDVNRDGAVSPTDAVAVIQNLGTPPESSNGLFLDLTGDGNVSPTDVLGVVQELDRLNALDGSAVAMSRDIVSSPELAAWSVAMARDAVSTAPACSSVGVRSTLASSFSEMKIPGPRRSVVTLPYSRPIRQVVEAAHEDLSGAAWKPLSAVNMDDALIDAVARGVQTVRGRS